MASEALDAAMDSIYSQPAVAGGDAEASTGDALDEFLGDLLPGANVENVDAYLEDIMGPEAAGNLLGSEDEPASSAEEDDPLLDLEL